MCTVGPNHEVKRDFDLSASSLVWIRGFAAVTLKPCELAPEVDACEFVAEEECYIWERF
jgi:hypothetical protein